MAHGVTQLDNMLICFGTDVGSQDPADTFWSGLIDDVRIYNQAIKP